MTLRWPIDALNDAGITPTQARRCLGNSTYYHAARQGGFNDWQADRVAIAHGLHPAIIWSGWADAALGPLDDLYLEGGWRQAWLWNEQGAA